MLCTYDCTCKVAALVNNTADAEAEVKNEFVDASLGELRHLVLKHKLCTHIETLESKVTDAEVRPFLRVS